MIRHESPLTGWIAAASISCLLAVLALLPPFVSEGARQFLMAAFSQVCHQIPARSPHINGIQLAVCDRCIGIYGTLAAASFAFLFFRRWDGIINRHARLLIPLSLFIPGFDWFGDVVGLWQNTPWSRGATGAVFGLTAGYFFCRALVQLFGNRRVDGPGAGRNDSTYAARG